MIVETIQSGPFLSNSFVAGCGKTRLALVVDPADDVEALFRVIESHRLTPQAMVLTHGHFDHLHGNARVRERYPELPIYCHPDDAAMLTSSMRNLSSLVAESVKSPAATNTLEDGNHLAVGMSIFDVLHIPGHTPGGICLYAADAGVVFTGDTLFKEGIGRTDFPGGNHDQLIAGIKTKLLTLPDETVVYPGHGEPTTIGHEKQANPFLMG